MIEFDGVTYALPGLTSDRIPCELPDEYRTLLAARNGFIALGGALHLRGLCDEPAWHSLDAAWRGDGALSKLFPAILPTDIPFGQNCLGDQFVLRDGAVHELNGETGILEDQKTGLFDFLDACRRDPDRFLALNVLESLLERGEALEPGQLINVYPPFCSRESAQGVSLRAISTPGQVRFLSRFAGEIADLPDGTQVRIVVE